MDDLISRKAAIHAFDDAGFCTHDYVVGTLEDLPSAHPTQTNADSTQTNALDCVSREAAIDAMRKLQKWNVMREDYKNVGFLYDDVMFTLEKLPSAQPEVAKDTNVPNNDCISRQAAIDGIKKEILERDGQFYKGLLVANHVILHLPSAQPEVLACGSGELVQESDSLVKDLVKDCISREAVLDAIDKYILGKPEGCTVEVKELLKLSTKIYHMPIYRMPSAQPERYWIDSEGNISALPSAQPERKRGRWLPDNNCYYETRYMCSECKLPFHVETIMMKPSWRFCPNCGARMDGEANE